MKMSQVRVNSRTTLRRGCERRNHLPSDAHDVLEEHVAKFTEPWCKERIGKNNKSEGAACKFQKWVQYQHRHIN